MFRISRLQELLKPLPRGVFERVVREHGAAKHDKKFNAWGQLIAMVYGQLSGASSLRVLEASFNSQSPHHYHLGTGALHRSTLADANRKREVGVYAQVTQHLMQQVSSKLREEMRDCLYLLDSTSFTLKGPGFDAWTKDTRTPHTQGIKLHIVYEANEQAPVYQSMSAPNVNDIDEAHDVLIEPGATYVFDKGYCDYNWWLRLDGQGARFVTRFKRNAALAVQEVVPIPAADAGHILHDEIVRFTNKYPGGGRCNRYEHPLRRIVLKRPDCAEPLTLATNDLTSPASTIAQLYKDRWRIELFFKWIKQHLKIKSFLGTSQNAVHIQILCALIAYLLLALYRKAHGIRSSMWHLLSELRATLFQRPDIEAAMARRRRQQQAELLNRQPQLAL